MRRPTFLCSDFLTDIFFPNRCPSCDRVIAWNMVVCEDCEGSLEYIGDIPWQSYFPDKIGGEDARFDHAQSLFWYKGAARNAVLSLKHRGAFGFARYCAERLALKLESDGVCDVDIVTAVPMHRKKRVSRGYDQAEVIARALSSQLGVRCDLTLLKHAKSSIEQHDRDRASRLSAAAETYFIADETVSLEGKRVLICDDILTTGATVNACAGLLKQMGAERVYVATICRTAQESE